MNASLPLPKGWTPNQIKRWLALRADGKSNAQIARATGRTLRVIEKLGSKMRELGHDIPHAEVTIRLFNDDEKALILALASEGLGPTEISGRILADLGIDRSVSGISNSIYYREGRHAVKRRQAELRAALRQPTDGVVTHRIVADRIVPVMPWGVDCMGFPLSKPVTLPRLSFQSERAA